MRDALKLWQVALVVLLLLLIGGGFLYRFVTAPNLADNDPRARPLNQTAIVAVSAVTYRESLEDAPLSSAEQERLMALLEDALKTEGMLGKRSENATNRPTDPVPIAIRVTITPDLPMSTKTKRSFQATMSFERAVYLDTESDATAHGQFAVPLKSASVPQAPGLTDQEIRQRLIPQLAAGIAEQWRAANPKQH